LTRGWERPTPHPHPQKPHPPRVRVHTAPVFQRVKHGFAGDRGKPWLTAGERWNDVANDELTSNDVARTSSRRRGRATGAVRPSPTSSSSPNGLAIGPEPTLTTSREWEHVEHASVVVVVLLVVVVVVVVVVRSPVRVVDDDDSSKSARGC
jgi:hypothetical protein